MFYKQKTFQTADRSCCFFFSFKADLLIFINELKFNQRHMLMFLTADKFILFILTSKHFLFVLVINIC